MDMYTVAVVVLDEAGKPVAQEIIWQTADRARALRELQRVVKKQECDECTVDVK